MRNCLRMVIDHDRSKRAHNPMVERSHTQRQQEWQPILIENDKHKDNEEVKMRLDISTRQMYQSCGRADEAHRGQRGTQTPTNLPDGGQSSEYGHDGALREHDGWTAMYDQAKAREPNDMQHQQIKEQPVSPGPCCIGQHEAPRKHVPYIRKGRPMGLLCDAMLEG